MLKVADIANKYGVTRWAVYLWLKNGLPYQVKKEIGRKPYKVIDPADVEKFHGIGGSDDAKNS